ncbi:MAG: ferrous iron transport protein B [Methanomicrobiales archaeon HGW-Methanomicrobiales-1]|jgi:ferrous iron transport protein B|nr:MAG: ferrous iron transport protein B [Methanomicrobiales archaeon HGW-Methanomicrobiales-1]
MKIALMGNPGVGKSLIFNQLTGLGVEVNRYPGSSVALECGNVCYKQEKTEIVDLPGIYSLDGNSEEETLVRTFLTSGGADVIVAVLDATKLERNLYLFVQAAEFSPKMIAVVNMNDAAERHGMHIDADILSSHLGVPVILAAASEGRNIDRILPVALGQATTAQVHVPYDHHIEAALKSLEKTIGTPRQTNLLALQGTGNDPVLLDAAGAIAQEIGMRHQMSVDQIIATNRHNFARAITAAVVKRTAQKKPYDLDSLLTRSFPGIPILCAILFFLLLSVFMIGSWMEVFIVEVFTSAIITPFTALALPPLWDRIGFSVLIALQAGLGIAFPFIFTFYIGLSLLEDTGYMTRAAFLADRAMHRIGLHGEAIIPMVIGFGCTVPAVMSLRLLKTRREQTIGAFLVTMIPCSARTVVIAGIVAAFVGIAWAFSIYLIVFVLLILTAVVLSRITPGEQFGMIVEMSTLRMPKAGLVLAKSWLRIKEFLFIAMPVLIATSILLGLFQYFGLTELFEQMVAPVTVTLLGLPGYASTALLFGVFRKELAFETLAVLAGTADLGSVMSSVQLYTFAIVSVLFVPCVSTIAVLYRQLGAKIAIVTSVYTVFLGLFIGAIINLLMK